MALAVGRRPVTTEVRVRSRVLPCEMFGGHALGQGFLRARRFSSVIVIPPIFRTRLYVHVVARSNGQSLGTFQQAVLFRKSGGVG